MFLGGLFMIGLALRDHYLRDMAAKTRHGNELDVAIFKALGNMIWISMPESVEEKCYGCRGVTDEEGRPKFFGSQRDHDVCCMMTPEEQIDYISEDVIHKILTTPELREELFARVEVEIPNQEDRKIVKEILSRSKSNFPSERFLLNNLVHITDYAKFLLRASATQYSQETSLLKKKHEQQSDEEEVYI